MAVSAHRQDARQDAKRIPWTRELPMHAHNQSGDWVAWHPYGDVLKIITARYGLPTVSRAHQSAAARALEGLRDHNLVSVRRAHGVIDRYRLTKKGQGRATELLEHDGVTAKMAERFAEADRRRRNLSSGLKTRIRRLDPETGEYFDAGYYTVPTLTMMLRGLRSDRAALERELFENDDLLDALRDRNPDAVEHVVHVIRSLASIRWQLSTRKKHEKEQRRVREHNDRLWPDLRRSLIDSGYSLASDAHWWALPRDLRPRAYPPLLELEIPSFSLTEYHDN